MAEAASPGRILFAALEVVELGEEPGCLGVVPMPAQEVEGFSGDSPVGRGPARPDLCPRSGPRLVIDPGPRP